MDSVTYINCYTATTGYTNVPRRFRAAIEQGKLTYEDYSQDVLMLMLHASSLGLPFLPVRLMQGSGLMKFWGISEEKRKAMPKIENLKCAEIENPMVPGQKVVAVPVPKIDTAIIHVQQASPDGTCIIMGDEFHDIDIAIAARKTIVTCEEIVSDEFIRRDPTKTRIFGECVQAVVKAPYGAWPSQCYAYYDDPEFVQGMNAHHCQFNMDFAEMINKHTQLDYACIVEDMAGKQGSLVSKAIWDEFMRPYYVKLIDKLHSLGVKKILVDSDGNTAEICKWLVDVGIDGHYPLPDQWRRCRPSARTCPRRR